MTDRELLELAAKAAGINGEVMVYENMVWLSKPDFSEWDPIDDDGDAMQLAVILNNFEPYRSNGGWRISTGLSQSSARRAIVHAAAEIGLALAHDDAQA